MLIPIKPPLARFENVGRFGENCPLLPSFYVSHLWNTAPPQCTIILVIVPTNENECHCITTLKKNNRSHTAPLLRRTTIRYILQGFLEHIFGSHLLRFARALMAFFSMALIDYSLGLLQRKNRRIIGQNSNVYFYSFLLHIYA